jgi:DNA-binding transcriptional regulator/RsmH inhibitor MraZ
MKREGRFTDIAVHSGSSTKTIDKNGRITLTKELIDNVSLKREIVFVGRLDFFTIWDKIKFEEFLKESGSAADKAWDIFEEIQETTEDI